MPRLPAFVSVLPKRGAFGSKDFEAYATMDLLRTKNLRATLTRAVR